MNRQDFLRRVREAAGRAETAPVPPPPAPITASTPQNPRTLAGRFKRENEAALGRVHLVESVEEARELLAKLVKDARTFVRTPHAILDEVGLPGWLSPAPPEDADVGVTGCELAVAATGSVAYSSAWGRLAALLPNRHVTILRASQIMPDLEDAYLSMDPRDMPGAWGLHTGPSKSADIEQIMALGVHGPGEVDVIVLLPS